MKVTNSKGELVDFPETSKFRDSPRLPVGYSPNQTSGLHGNIKCGCENDTFLVRFFSFQWAREFYTEVECTSCKKIEVLSDFKRGSN